jgi:hypothetical protein
MNKGIGAGGGIASVRNAGGNIIDRTAPSVQRQIHILAAPPVRSHK